jgi:hypothetical protein
MLHPRLSKNTLKSASDKKTYRQVRSALRYGIINQNLYFFFDNLPRKHNLLGFKPY